jgi:hypothetical protein
MCGQADFSGAFLETLGVQKEETRPTGYEEGVGVGVSAKLFAKQFLDL